MVNLFRKYQQSLLVVVTIVIIITFVYYWNGTQAGRLERSGSDTVGTIYGRRVSGTELGSEARRFDIAVKLGLFDMLQSLVGFDPMQRYENFVWNSRVLRHEAQQLQIEATDDEVQEDLVNLPALQTNGQFDPRKLAAVIQEDVSPRGLTNQVIDEILRDDVRLKKLKELIGSSVEVSPAEFRSLYMRSHEKMTVSVVRFNTADMAAGIQISDEDAQKAFEQRKDQFKSDEKRKIKFATFELDEAGKKLKGKERLDALQDLRAHATDFTQAMLEKDAKFDEVAAKFHAPVTVTDYFTQNTADPLLAKLPAVSAAAFKMKKEDVISDLVPGENGFYVVHVEDLVPSKPLTFEEAKPKVIELLKKERSQEMLNTKAAEARKKIEEELKAGKSFADAAAAAGVKAETLPAFSIADRTKLDTPDTQQILEKSVTLGEKQLSDFTPSEAGGLLVYMEKREPADEATMEKDKVALLPMFERQKRNEAFAEWMRLRREAAKITITQR